MIRKETWMNLLDDFEEIAGMLKKNAKHNYFKKIYWPVMNEKNRFINKHK